MQFSLASGQLPVCTWLQISSSLCWFENSSERRMSTLPQNNKNLTNTHMNKSVDSEFHKAKFKSLRSYKVIATVYIGLGFGLKFYTPYRCECVFVCGLGQKLKSTFPHELYFSCTIVLFTFLYSWLTIADTEGLTKYSMLLSGACHD